MAGTLLVNGLNMLFKNVSYLPYHTVFSPNKGKYKPEKNSYLDTFHALPVFGVFQLKYT